MDLVNTTSVAGEAMSAMVSTTKVVGERLAEGAGEVLLVLSELIHNKHVYVHIHVYMYIFTDIK